MATGKKNAARLKASLVFLDEAGFLMAPLVRRTWAPRGQTPLLHQRTRSHRKVSVIGALTVSPRRDRVRCYFRLHPDTNINGDLLVCFLRQLVKQLDAPILLIWDRLKAHRGRAMTGYLHAAPTVRAVLLPAYAPELNPIEYLWGYAKTNPLANCAPLDLATLTANTRKAARFLQCNQPLLRSFLQHSPLFLRLK